jgi:NAD(P)-dependent dehydrogenase (short-subunit alcohol dehydrogenase family)
MDGERSVPRRALVLGAGTDGIGRAAVRALAAAGLRVGIHHRDEPKEASALAAETRGGPVLEGDFADPAAARAVVREALARLGGLDVLVFCCARLLRRPFLDTTDAEWRAVHDINLAAAFAAGQEAARAMAGQGWGRIVFVSSVNEFAPNAGLCAYAASKGGLRMLARVMALELAPAGITVNLVAPGTIETDLNRAALADPQWRAAKRALIPVRRIGEPSDIGGIIAFLASDAASYVTGATLVADGGLSLGVQP